MKRAEDFFDGPTHRILETPARQFLGHGIDVIDGRVGIRRDDAIADRLQGDLRAFFLSEQRLFVQLALGNVELNADESQQPTVLVHTGRGATDDPAPLAIAVPHAVSAFK